MISKQENIPCKRIMTNQKHIHLNLQGSLLKILNDIKSNRSYLRRLRIDPSKRREWTVAETIPYLIEGILDKFQNLKIIRINI
ncbi:unnamed protein product (macronuclear) [Paramecium tetraurelia]|uniref:Uncharacterized protein n=1 Tax=Paramecium tetraurelia TaxID=5888 RepID=A0E211_PARTE|nr:uncharacterized protein GSPATT00022499001 [Paramecium tetraurelia]CAK89328.1 unnamed protein product [Paramecium tetraurelia]|eukprot:XP_001456725.1 hypothetical protein (macronuclear) [Paramecium tetraurelia strain d4-2]